MSGTPAPVARRNGGQSRLWPEEEHVDRARDSQPGRYRCRRSETAACVVNVVSLVNGKSVMP